MKKKTKKKIGKKVVKQPTKRKVVKKITKKKGAKKISAKKLFVGKPLRLAQGKPIGTVTHFYNAIKVAIAKFKKPVKVGTRLAFKGATTDFAETVKSMQYDHKSVAVAPKGKQIGIKVGKRVREGDSVYEVK